MCVLLAFVLTPTSALASEVESEDDENADNNPYGYVVPGEEECRVACKKVNSRMQEILAYG